MTRAITALLAGLLAALAIPAQAQETLTPDEARELVASFVGGVFSCTASFTQVLSDEGGTVVETESGQLWLQRPGQFRWEYQSPWERLIVSDGDSVWLYDSELEQVTVRSAEAALMASPAALLVGDLAALGGYEYSGQTVPDAPFETLVTLTPDRSDGDFESIDLRFDETNMLVELSLLDKFGQRTVVTLDDIATNQDFSAELFSFSVPEGTDVIDQTGD